MVLLFCCFIVLLLYCIEVLQVGISGKYDGWLELRAARTPTGFVTREWLNPRCEGRVDPRS